MRELKLEPLFADFFVEEKLNIDHESIVKFIKRQKEKSQGPSIYFTGSEPELGQFYGTVQTIADAMHEKLRLHKQLKQRMYMAWANIETNEFITAPHSHSERAYALISGVYYPKAPENCYPLGFMSNNRSVEHVIYRDLVEEPNEFNVAQIEKQPTTGTVFLFPSWLTHYVVQKSDKPEDERISLAFNFDMTPID